MSAMELGNGLLTLIVKALKALGGDSI
jgi:hypothetical protein